MENKIELKLKNRTKLHGGLCGKLSWIGKRNFPDRSLLLPHGYIVFAECKDVNKDFRKTQRWFSKILTRLGFKVYLVRYVEDIDLIFDDYKNFLKANGYE